MDSNSVNTHAGEEQLVKVPGNRLWCIQSQSGTIVFSLGGFIMDRGVKPVVIEVSEYLQSRLPSPQPY
jgi:hypothetical protein